jgi:ankyrin repeat protein
MHSLAFCIAICTWVTVASCKNLEPCSNLEELGARASEELKRGDFSTLNQLVDAGCANKLELEAEMTPLHWAVLHKKLNLIEVLLAQGSDVNARSVPGNRPLTYAVGRACSLEIAKTLIEHGADPKQQSNVGATHLHGACNPEMALYLIGLGLDVNAGSSGLESALYLNVWAGNTGVAKVLVDNGADLDRIGPAGETVLYLAVRRNNKELVQILVAKGADKCLKDKKGQTAVDLAKAAEDLGIIEILVGGQKTPICSPSKN